LQRAETHKPAQPNPRIGNVGDLERLLSVADGAALGGLGLTRGSIPGLALAAVGGVLIHRGLTGQCALYDALGVSTAEAMGSRASVAAGHGVKVEKSFTVNRSPEELYRYWRAFENLPTFMRHLQRVTVLDERRSHWVARAPLGKNVEWDAEIIGDEAGQLIAWRSLENADVDNAGSVHFTEAPAGRGTVLKVVLKYDPPAGSVGAALAKLFGEAPEQQIDEDLRRFKQLMETGELPTTAGQPVGSCRH